VGCTFPNHDAAQNPTQPLEHSMPVRDDSARVHGVVNTGDPMLPTRLQFVVVELVKADKVIRQTSTDHDGRFAFTGAIPQGSYEVRVAGAYAGAAKVVLSGTGSDEVTIQAISR
jgi:hypothetical protein